MFQLMMALLIKSSFLCAPPDSSANLLLNFDKDRPGNIPRQWKLAGADPGKQVGEWQIRSDPSAPSAPNVMSLTRTKNTGHTYNVAIYSDWKASDVDLSVKLKAVSGKEDQGGGLIWRCADENNYYICRINPLENNFRVYKVVAGKRDKLGSVDIKLEKDKWYTVRATMSGDKIGCYLDGKMHLSVSDKTFAGEGLVGLWTKADAASSFDDFRAEQK